MVQLLPEVLPTTIEFRALTVPEMKVLVNGTL
jgi:hypothetical protein